MKKLDSPQIKETAIKRLAVGESQANIAQWVGVHQSQVSRFANREDVRTFIEQEQMKLIEAVPDAVENVKKLVREMKNIPKKEIKRTELGYKASHDVLKAVGLMPTPVQSQVITTIYNDNRNQTLLPLIQEILRKYLEPADETLDAEFKEENVTVHETH